MAAAVKRKKSRRRLTKAPRLKQQFSFIENLNTTSGVRITEDVAITLSAVYRAVSLISQTVGMLPIHVRKRTEINGHSARVLLPGHAVQRLLRGPNEEQTPFTFFESIAKAMCLWGNYFAEIERAPNQKVTNIYPLPPSMVRVERNTDTGNLEYTFGSDLQTQKVLGPRQVLHVALMGDGVLGKSPIAAARESIGLGLATERMGSSLFGRGMVPSGVLQHPGKVGTEAGEALKKQIARQAGPGAQRGVLILEQGMTWNQIGIPPEDAQFLETRKFQIDEVARWFGVPPHMLAQLEKSSFSNITHQSLEFVQYTIMHFLVRIEQEINRKLFDPRGDVFVKFEVEGLLRGDPETQAKVDRERWTHGVTTINEIRVRMDQDPIEEGGDERFIPANMVPLKRALKEPEPPEPPEPDGDDDDGNGDEPIPAGPGEGGEPNIEPDDTNAVRDILRDLFRDAVGRVVHKEVSSLRRLIKKYGGNGETEGAMKEFFKRHEDDVAKTMGPIWEAHAKIVGIECDVGLGASRYTERARTMCLGLFREQGIEALTRHVDMWVDCRADMVTEEYLEAYRGNWN